MNQPTILEIVDDRVTRDGTRLFTTLEGENPSGSIKDRMVLGELSELLHSGSLSRGDMVSEVSAGSTAKALAYHCRELGLVCELFVPDTLPDEEAEALEGLGANVHRGSREEGFALYDQFCEENPVHRLDQLSDQSLLRHYRALGAAANEQAGPFGAVLGAVGTGHSLLGVAEGVEPRPFVATAEPAEPYAILGVRNLELERYGPQDSCKPEMFDLRLVVAGDERRDFGPVETDQGQIEIGTSFALVLSAVDKLLEEQQAERLFLIGAQNRRR